METQNIDRGIKKQLTATEISLAVAEIRDRLMRYILATHDCHYADPIMEEDYARKKHEIPDGVALLYEMDMEPKASTLANFSPIIRDWVNGKLTAEEAEYMLFYFQEFNEIDYGWVFMDEPMWFYSDSFNLLHAKAMDQKFIEIGTRSSKKRKGKPIRSILVRPF